jgi:UDP-glucose 4-epimerase
MAPARNGFFNLGNGEGYSVRNVIDVCRQISNRPIATVEKPRRPGDPPRLVASAEKARHELGWRPQDTRLEDIVASAWQWHAKHPSGYED